MIPAAKSATATVMIIFGIDNGVFPAIFPVCPFTINW